MRIVLVYMSSTGFTERYAKYIASKVGADIIRYKDRKDAKDYDVLIYGGPIIAGAVSGSKWFEKERGNYSHSFLFATGANPKENNSELEAFLNAERKKGRKLYYMPGGLNYERMGKLQYFVMKKIFLAMVKSQKGEDSEMYKKTSSSYSLYDERYAEELIKDIQEIQKKS